MGHVVHQEGFKLAFQPQDALLGLHVDIQSAQDAFTLCVNVLNDVEGQLVNRDTNPTEQLSFIQRWRKLRLLLNSNQS